MNIPRRSLVFGLALAALAGCDNATGNSVDNKSGPGTASAPTDNPVGPVPGPGDATLPQNPYAEDPAALMEGRKLFVQFNCAGCHGTHGGGGMGPSLRDRAWIYGNHQADIFDSIYDGRAHGMPAWGSVIPEDYIWKITAYIGSMRTADEPQPPR